jgi:spermidine synthase/MFS family permease
VNTKNNKHIPIYSVALLSATALAYEVLLVRFLSIIQWHHYAYMIISLALLGYGASGTFLAIFQNKLLKHFHVSYITNITLFGLSSLFCFMFVQGLSFNPQELLFDRKQWLILTAIYLILSIPFFFAANAIGLALIQFRSQLSRIYAADLVGAAFGSLAIVLLLFIVFPTLALRLLSVLGIAAALLAAWEIQLHSRRINVMLSILLLILVLIPASSIQLTASPYKDLSQTLRISGTRIVEQQSSPLGLVSVVESTKIPLRHAPQLSLNAITELPPQLGLFIDGNGPSPITQFSEGNANLDYLDFLSSALPYHLKRTDKLLVLGAGGGSSVLQGLHLGAKQIDAVELNPQVIELVREKYGNYAGNIYKDKRVQLINKEARAYLSANEKKYGLIQVPILDSFNASATGLFSLSEDYLYTIEAFKLYLQHLELDGYLLINRWIKVPPRDTLKIIATVIATLKQQGISDIAQRLVVIRGWQTSAVLIKNGTFTAEELQAIRTFCQQRSFDVAYLPDISEEETNRFNSLNEPYYYQGTKALLGNAAEQFIDQYKFKLTPATDDQPFFFQFFRWRSFKEILGLYGRGGAGLIDTGYLVSIATLAQAFLASLILILLPLFFYQRQNKDQQRQHQAVSRTRVLIYFTALGLAFLFIEIAFIQKLMLLLHHPLYAVAVSLTAFLLFAGIGCAYSERFNHDQTTGIVKPVSMILLLSLLYLLTLESVFAMLMQLPDAMRIVISVIVIAPLAFCMGMPFPKGLAQLGQHAPDLIPWAWGINGCASVISAVLAGVIANHFGFSSVIIIAILLYLLAVLSFPQAHSSSEFGILP